MKILFQILFLSMFFTKVYSQVVEVEDKIILTNPNEDLRKVKEVKNPSTETDAVRSGFFINGMSQFAAATGSNDTIQLTIYPGIASLVPGVTLNFLCPIANTDAVKIKINGHNNYYSLHKKGTVDLDIADLINGQMVSIVFDGNEFQVISQLNKSCPNGFIQVTREYCIQQIESTSAFFWNAVRNCGDMNSRVCTWGEWYYACYKSSSLGITDMLGGWEWADGGGNSLSFTTPPTANTGLMVGDSTCTVANSSIVDTTHTNVRAQKKPYHCCYSLK